MHMYLISIYMYIYICMSMYVWHYRMLPGYWYIQWPRRSEKFKSLADTAFTARREELPLQGPRCFGGYKYHKGYNEGFIRTTTVAWRCKRPLQGSGCICGLQDGKLARYPESRHMSSKPLTNLHYFLTVTSSPKPKPCTLSLAPIITAATHSLGWARSCRRALH